MFCISMVGARVKKKVKQRSVGVMYVAKEKRWIGAHTT